MHLENPPVPVGPRIYRFTDFARNPEKIPPSLFTFNKISSTGSAVCISKTHLCRSDPDFPILLFYYFTILRFYDFTILLFYYFTILLFYYFTILLFYYFTILLFYNCTILLFYYFINFTGNREFTSRKPTCAGWTQNLPLFLISREIQRKFLPLSLCAGPTQILLFYYFTILLFYYFTILLFYYFTILLFYYFTILLFYYFTILLFYYFTILLFYYFTILLILREIGSLHLENPPVPVGPRIYHFTDFARNPEKIPLSLFTCNKISSTASAVYISKTHLCRLDPGFTTFYYFTIFTRNHLPLHVGPQESLHLENLPWHVGPPICMSDRGIPPTCRLTTATVQPVFFQTPKP